VALAPWTNLHLFRAFCARWNAKLSGHLSAFEVMWEAFLPPGDHRTCEGRRAHCLWPSYYVLHRTTGRRRGVRRGAFESALGEALEQGAIVDAVIAKSQAERNAIWSLRDDVGQCAATGPFLPSTSACPSAK